MAWGGSQGKPYEGLVPFQTTERRYNREIRDWETVLRVEQLSYYESYMDRDGSVQWRENTPFNANLRLTNVTRGRSAHNAHFLNLENGEHYSMFAAEFAELLKNPKIWGAYLNISGQWAFRKQGANYGLVRVGAWEG